jgi:hypothetical protein
MAERCLVSEGVKMVQNLEISTLIFWKRSFALEKKGPEVYVWDLDRRELRFGDHFALDKDVSLN